jgi:hypothetical protein
MIKIPTSLKDALDNNSLIFFRKPIFYYGGENGGKVNSTYFFYKRLIESKKIIEEYNNSKKEFQLMVFIPKFSILQSNFFDEFMYNNDLFKVVQKAKNDKELLNYFLSARFSEKQKKVLNAVLNYHTEPIVVRSSALNEDMANASFAGIFYSLFLPNNKDTNTKLFDLENAIKFIYFSLFSSDAKEYASLNKLIMSDQKMSIIIQDVAGRYYYYKNRELFFPTFSFVAFSFNDYPIDVNKNEGFYKISFGLGEGIVQINKQTALSIDLAKPNPPMGIYTQKDFFKLPTNFYALDLSKNFDLNMENLKLLEIKNNVPFEIYSKHCIFYDEKNGEFKNSVLVVDDYTPYLRFEKLTATISSPLNYIIKNLLDLAKKDFSFEVDIEGGGDIIQHNNKNILIFYPFQARPQIRNSISSRLDFLPNINKDQIVLKSKNAIGKGGYELNAIVLFDLNLNLFLYSKDAANELNEINSYLKEINKKYFLVVPGRLGTSDPVIGIPARFSSISFAGAIAEKIISQNVNSSQGSHFYEQIVGSQIAYLSFENKNSLNLNLIEKNSYQKIKKEFSAIYLLKNNLKLLLDKFGNCILFFDE